MRGLHLILIPLAGGLLACSGIAEQLGLGGGGAPEVPEGFRCSAGEPAGGGLAEGAEGWWTWGEPEGDAGERLARFWRFPPASAAMKTGDAQWYCLDGAQRSGPYLRLTADPESWVEGYYEGGDPQGTWKGGYGDEPGEATAFEGLYSYGERDGGWSFYGEDGALVARGDYREGLAHGDWRFTSATAEHSYRYILGRRHGLWRELDPKGSSVKSGAYFNDKKHGVWIEQTLDEESGELVETGREVWDEGTRLGPDARDPMEGPDGAREVLRAYLEADLAGGRLSSEGYREYPVLSDFADPTQLGEGDPVYDKAIITRMFTIGDVEVTGVTAKIVVQLQEVCEVVAGSVAQAVDREEEITFTLKQQDGFWRLDTPSAPPHPSMRAYLSEVGDLSDELARQIHSRCGKAGEEKGGKAARGERPGGKAGKAGRGGKLGKGGKGGKAGKAGRR